MVSLFLEKTIRQLGKTENTSSVGILSTLLVSPDEEARQLAFDALYRKKTPDVYLLLFHCFVKNEATWQDCSSITTERLSKLADAAFRSDKPALKNKAAEIILKYKLYENLPLVVANLENSDPNQAQQAKTMLLALAESFYGDLASAPSETERRNLDRRREWFVQQLDGPIKRCAVHKIEELIEALLIVTKKDYGTMRTVNGDHRSAACMKIVELLETGDHGSYLRLLLSYLPDASSPPQIDQVLENRSDINFVRKLLEFVGTNPPLNLKDALKRFKNFDWFKPENPKLPEIVEFLESNAVQLLMASGFSKNRMVDLHRFFMRCPSCNARRASADAMRRMVGDEVNKLLLEHVNDPDGPTAAMIFRILKSRGVPELDHHLIELVERPEEEIRSAIYEMIPELHAESFAARIGQMMPETAKKLGRYVRQIDRNTFKVISDDIMSPIPVRRYSACALAAATGYASDFKDRLIELVDTDGEVNVRTTALLALGTVMTKDALEVIKAFLEDRSMDMREAAGNALHDWMSNYQARNESQKNKPPGSDFESEMQKIQ